MNIETILVGNYLAVLMLIFTHSRMIKRTHGCVEKRKKATLPSFKRPK